MTNIYIGTCGFAYLDWEGYFYPPKLPAYDRLSYYADRFRAVEIDSTFYRIPRANDIEKMVKRTRKEFRFTVKAHQSITHEFGLSAAEFGAFRRAVAPIVNSGRLGAILAQFPPAFQCTRDSVQMLRTIRAEFYDMPLAVELRHHSWNRPETFDFLRKHNIACCSADVPALENLFPPHAERTADFAYIRLHGRNAAFWQHARTAAERHNYLYSEEELEEWAARIEQLAQDSSAVYVMLSNIYEAKAIVNARQLARRLGLPFVGIAVRSPHQEQPKLALA